jgi:hypothetical protein
MEWSVYENIDETTKTLWNKFAKCRDFFVILILKKKAMQVTEDQSIVYESNAKQSMQELLSVSLSLRK